MRVKKKSTLAQHGKLYRLMTINTFHKETNHVTYIHLHFFDSLRKMCIMSCRKKKLYEEALELGGCCLFSQFCSYRMKGKKEQRVKREGKEVMGGKGKKPSIYVELKTADRMIREGDHMVESSKWKVAEYCV